METFTWNTEYAFNINKLKLNKMRKVTEETVNAFYNSLPFKKANMEIEVLPNVTIMKLHSNAIVFKYNDPERTLSITNCGWKTKTIKERLNAIDGVNIYQKKGQWFLNGKEWDGELIDVKCA
jgi:hypothetical protein